MKVEHRAKAIESYKGARELLKLGHTYSSYVLLKESTRATLAYIAEDMTGRDFSEKKKLRNLMDMMPIDILTPEYEEKLHILLELESSDLTGLLNADMDKLRDIKSVLKQLIGQYLGQHI